MSETRGNGIFSRRDSLGARASNPAGGPPQMCPPHGLLEVRALPGRRAASRRGETRGGARGPADDPFPPALAMCFWPRGARGRSGWFVRHFLRRHASHRVHADVCRDAPEGPVIRELILLEPWDNLRLVHLSRRHCARRSRALYRGGGGARRPQNSVPLGAPVHSWQGHTGGEFAARPRESSEPTRRPLSVSPGGTGSGGRALASPRALDARVVV